MVAQTKLKAHPRLIVPARAGVGSGLPSRPPGARRVRQRPEPAGQRPEPETGVPPAGPRLRILPPADAGLQSPADARWRPETVHTETGSEQTGIGRGGMRLYTQTVSGQTGIRGHRYVAIMHRKTCRVWGTYT